MTVGNKLPAGLGVMLARSIALGDGALTSIGRMEATVEKLALNPAKELQLAEEAGAAESEMRAAQRGTVLSAIAGGQARSGQERAGKVKALAGEVSLGSQERAAWPKCRKRWRRCSR